MSQDNNKRSVSEIDGGIPKKQKPDQQNANNFMNNNQLDDILNDNLPGIDMKLENKDVDSEFNFDFDFLDSPGFDIPPVNPSVSGVGTPTALPSGISLANSATGLIDRPAGAEGNLQSLSNTPVPSVGPQSSRATPNPTPAPQAAPSGPATAGFSQNKVPIGTNNTLTNAAQSQAYAPAKPAVTSAVPVQPPGPRPAAASPYIQVPTGGPVQAPAAVTGSMPLKTNGVNNAIPAPNQYSAIPQSSSVGLNRVMKPGVVGSNQIPLPINNNNINAAIAQRPLIYNPKSGTITAAQTPINRMNPIVQQQQGIKGLNTSNIDKPPIARPQGMNPDGGVGTGTNLPSKASLLHTDDPVKLNDALAAAGVDIQQEEEILMQQHSMRNRYLTPQQQQYLGQKQMQYPRTSPFLNPYHLSSFMQKVARENGVSQNFLYDAELLELMSAACENWISNIATKTIIMSRHRRRGIPTIIESKSSSKRGGGGDRGGGSTSTQRSEISKELRNLAVRQKELEEKRVQKRIALGLEDGTQTGEGEGGKAGAEETLHRAANATAAMMSTGKKKYSWMTAGSGAGAAGALGVAMGGSKSSESESKSKQSSIIAIRGDNGLRYREIRTGKTVTMKDLLGVLEDERMGAEKALIKGYAKLKD